MGFPLPALAQTNYQYDALGRLKTVDRPIALRQYTYDKANNLISITVAPKFLALKAGTEDSLVAPTPLDARPQQKPQAAADPATDLRLTAPK